MPDEKLQVNVDFTNFPELYKALEQRVKELDTDRSKFIRQLVRNEVLKDPQPTARAKKNASRVESLAA